MQHKLEDSQRRGADLYYREFLQALFFVGFAKPEADRAAEEKRLLGDVPYLNGGLFLPHHIEENHPDIFIPDEAFVGVKRVNQESPAPLGCRKKD